MKKTSLLLLVLALTAILSACGKRNMDMTTDTTQTTPVTITPTILPTIPGTEEHVPGTSFHPDEDGLIGQTDPGNTTETTVPKARMRMR